MILFLQEFLKKEYSHENIYFWTACERYRLGGGGDVSPTPSAGTSSATSARAWNEWAGRHASAAAIYNTHLGNNASEPVNVDSQARQVAQEGLHEPSQDLFAAVSSQEYTSLIEIYIKLLNTN